MRNRIRGIHCRTAVAALIAVLAIGIVATARAAGPVLQPMRPHTVAPRAPTTVRPGLHKVPIHMHVKWQVSCVGWAKQGQMFAGNVRLKSDGPNAVPRGTTVYWYIHNPRQWGVHRFPLGLAPGQTVLAKLPFIAGAGAPCTVVLHKLAWMGLQPLKPNQGMRRRPRRPSPAAGLPIGAARSKAVPKAVFHMPYHLSCEVKGWANPMTQALGASAVITNHGPGPVPAGTAIGFDVTDTPLEGGKTLTHPGGGEILTYPLAVGKQWTINFWPTDQEIYSQMTCTAHAK